MSTYSNVAAMLAALAEPRPAAELPVDPDPDLVERLQSALASNRPVTIVFPGELQVDESGAPTVTSAKSYQIGEVVD